MSDSRRPKQKGNTALEFTLAGIPVIFLLISTVEVSRAMFAYNSLSHCVREATRRSSTAGENCALEPNNCSRTVGDVARTVQGAAIGVPPSDLVVRLISTAGAITCDPVTVCSTDGAMWPPDGANATGTEITVEAAYLYRSAIAMYWPGAPAVQARASGFRFVASSTERIQF